jgi:hypothetical protein
MFHPTPDEREPKRALAKIAKGAKKTEVIPSAVSLGVPGALASLRETDLIPFPLL